MKEGYARRRDSFRSFYFEGQELVGEMGLPRLDRVERQEVDAIVPFNVMMSSTRKDRWMHFFIDDYQFERVWRCPTDYLALFRKARGIVTPDFSMYRDMPRAVQAYNCYRNRAVARYLQRLGLRIVPSVSWSDRDSFRWCFDGIARNSAVAISTNGVFQDWETMTAFLDGFYEMMARIDPCQVLCVGRLPDQLSRNPVVERFPSHGQVIKGRRTLPTAKTPRDGLGLDGVA